MKYVFLNPTASAGKTPQRWEKLAKYFENVTVVDDIRSFPWKDHSFQKDDTLISAGGDGTLHSLVNTLIKQYSLDFLQTVKIGHIGIGSNNSFLRPYAECKFIENVPVRVSPETELQDLIEVEINGASGFIKHYCVANASVGFLSKANHVFNTSQLVYSLKKKSTDVADVVTFIKTLSQWRSIPVRYESSAGDHEGHITNMHFMKRPFYAADMGFPEPIAPNSGTFRFNILNAVSNMDLAKRFSQVLLFKNFEQGRHATMEVPWIRIESNTEIPFEMDGEVVWGKNFSLRCVYAGVRLCL